jgi:ribosomal protein L37E
MTDQSGAFPETLREAALWEALKTYGQHRVGCPHPSCPDCRTHTMAASKTPGYSYCTRCGRGSIPTSDEACDCGFEAALERPRPAPPEDCSPEYVGAIIDATKETIAECVCAQDHPLLSGRFVGALLKRGLRIYPLRSAGTGAAPPDPLVQAAEEAANVLAGLATRVKWGGISNVSRSEEDHWRKLADDIRELIRGGAAQPPPSAPEQANSRWVQTIVRSPLCQAEGHLPSGDDSYCLRCGAVQEGEK